MVLAILAMTWMQQCGLVMYWYFIIKWWDNNSGVTFHTFSFAKIRIILLWVIKLDPITSGALLLIGQLCDGVATPFIGYIVDNISPCAARINRKKFWHLIGQTMTLTWVFIFTEPIGYSESWSLGGVFAYYVPFICVFQVSRIKIYFNNDL